MSNNPVFTRVYHRTLARLYHPTTNATSHACDTITANQIAHLDQSIESLFTIHTTGSITGSIIATQLAIFCKGGLVR